MPTMQELQATLSALPMQQRLEVLEMLEASVEAEMSDGHLASDLVIVKECLAEFDAGRMSAQPFDVAMQALFPNS